jgi:hypothetical protein
LYQRVRYGPLSAVARGVEPWQGMTARLTVGGDLPMFAGKNRGGSLPYGAEFGR